MANPPPTEATVLLVPPGNTTETSTKPQTKPLPFNLKPLGGLRGVSSLFIVAGHYFTNFAPIVEADWPTVSFEYFQPVTIFFLLSGFALSIFHSNLDTWDARKKFWVKRVARIAPMYYISLLLSIAPFTQYHAGSPGGITPNIILTPLFLQSFTLVGNDWCGPLWQVSAFMICYLVYPWLMKLVTKCQETRTRFWILAACSYFIPLLILAIFIAAELPAGTVHVWVVIRFPHFVLGVLLGLFCKEVQCGKWLSDIVTFLFVGIFAACAVFGQIYGPGVWWQFMLWAEFSLIPLHCFWIASFVCSKENGIIAQFFSSPVMSHLGDLSYSIYVIHYPMLYLYSWMSIGYIPPTQTRNREIHMGTNTLVDGIYALENWALLPAMCVIIVAAQLLTHYVEAPMRLWITEKLTPKPKPKPVEAENAENPFGTSLPHPK